MATACISVIALLLFLVFISCIRFGLPSRARIAAVTGEREPDGREGGFTDSDIARMEEAQAAIRASDESSLRILNSGALYDTTRMSVSEIESLRALRRMALYTTEPDEMHMPLSLSRMRPKKLDFNPHFFQYGGLFIYGVGGCIALGGLLGFYPLSGGLGHFLRDPEAMAALYTAGRLWSIMWATLVPIVAYRMARLFMPRHRAVVAALLASLAPAFFAFAPILKPVTSSSTAGLIAALMGARAAIRGRKKDWILAGVAVGVAGGLFPTHLILGLGIVAAALVAPGTMRDRVSGVVMASLAAGVVFIVCNPYWLVDIATIRADAAAAMQWYKPNVNFATVSRVLTEIVPEATGAGVLLTALFSIPIMFLRRPDGQGRPNGWGCDRAGMTLAAFALVDIVYYGWRITGVDTLGPMWCRQFAMAGPILTVLMVAALAGRTSRFPALGLLAAVIVVLPVIMKDYFVVKNFVRDSTENSTRFAAGRWIEEHIPRGSRIVLTQVPGPFSAPYFPLRNYEIVFTGDSNALRPGDHVILSGTANGYGMEPFFEALTPVTIFSCERMAGGDETFGFANGSVRIWAVGNPKSTI